MKSAIALLTAVMLLPVLLSAQDIEPNNALGNASPAPLNTQFSGTLGTPVSDTDDYYIVNLPNNGNVTAAAIFGAGLTGVVRIYRTTGTLLSSSNAGTGPVSVTENCVGSPQIVIRVERSSGSGTYTLQVSLSVPALPNDAEPNNSSSTTILTVEENQSFTGQIGYVNNGATDSDDYFTYNSPRNGNVTFSVTADPTFTYILRIYRPSGTLLISSLSATGNNSITLSCLQAGTYVGRIDRSAGCGSYTGSFSTTTLNNPNDAEPNNNLQTIGTFNENQVFTGQIGHTNNAGSVDSDDYFTYNNPRNGDITFTVDADPEFIYTLRIYRPSGTLLISNIAGTGLRTVTLNCAQEGTFVGRIDRSSGCGSYTASFSTTTNPNANDLEPNNSTSETQGVFNENQILTGQIGYTNNVGNTDVSDYFSYNNPRNGNVTFTATADPALTYIVRIYRPNGTLLSSSTSGTGTRTVTVNCLQPGIFVARVEHVSGCGSYSGSFSTSNLTHPADAEPNNSSVFGIFTTTKKNNFGHLGYQTNTGSTDSQDYYTIKITQVPMMLNIPFRFEETLTGVVRLYSATESLLISSTTSGPGVDNSLNYNFTIPGVYFLRIDHVSGCGSYRLGAPCAAGIDADNDNICDTDDDCIVNGGWVRSASQLTGLCVGDGFPDIIQASVTGRTGIGAYGLVNFPSLNVVATSASGAFNMELYPAGNYRIGHVSVTSVAQLNGITNPSQLTGCFDLSNTLTVSTIALVPGTISAASGITACGDDGIPSNLTFISTGAQGPSFRWAVLTSDFSTVLANNTTGIFDFDQFGPGSYRVVRAVYSGVNPATINPLSLPPCVRVSNIIVVNITSCAPALLVQPNPTAGESQVTFTANNDEWHTLEVYDMQGRLVQTLMSQMAQANEQYRFTFDGSYLPNGVYLYRLSSGSEVVIEKFMIAR